MPSATSIVKVKKNNLSDYHIHRAESQQSIRLLLTLPYNIGWDHGRPIV